MSPEGNTTEAFSPFAAASRTIFAAAALLLAYAPSTRSSENVQSSVMVCPFGFFGIA